MVLLIVLITTKELFYRPIINNQLTFFRGTDR